MCHGLRGGLHGDALVEWKRQNCWEPDVPRKTSWGNIVALFWSVTFTASWPKSDLTVVNITTNGTAGNIKITVFFGGRSGNPDFTPESSVHVCFLRKFLFGSFPPISC
jgi:hypothetical protein